MTTSSNIRPYCAGYGWTTISQDISKTIEGWVNSLKNDNESNLNKKQKKEEKLVIKKVIFSDPATIVLWNDGTKTVVKTQNGDPYDPEKGLAMACMRKMLSDKDYHEHLEEAQRVKNIPINEEERSNGV